MDNNELHKAEPQSNNGWQNVGICYQYARDNIPQKLRATFMEIVQQSFGRKKSYTNRFPHSAWAKLIGISEKTFFSHIHSLTEIGAVSINVSNSYIASGGSEAFSYSPIYPKGYGSILLESTTKKESNNSEPQIKEWKPYEDI